MSDVTYDYSGRVVIVTGASKGIGLEVALGFAKAGAKVVVSSRSDEGEQAADRIKQGGGEAIFIRANIAKEAEVAKLVETTVDTYGRLDFAVNNAGHSGKNGFLHEQTEENYDAVFDSNVRGAWLCMKHELLAMLKNDNGNGYGRIVNVASSAGLISIPRIGMYAASKHALLGFTQTAGLEYATRGIRINAVVPGSVKTHNYDIFSEFNDDTKRSIEALHATPDILEATDCVPAILFLCSEGVAFSIGSPLYIDGGLTAGHTPRPVARN